MSRLDLRATHRTIVGVHVAPRIGFLDLALDLKIDGAADFAIHGDTPREPLGVLAVPGAYLVTLTAGGKTYTHPLTLRMDPRATITPLGLTQQFTLATKVVDMMNKSFAAISRANQALSPQPSAPGAQPPAPDPASDLIALNNDLATAYDVVEGADRAPTTQATKVVAHLEQRLTALLKRTP